MTKIVNIIERERKKYDNDDENRAYLMDVNEIKNKMLMKIEPCNPWKEDNDDAENRARVIDGNERKKIMLMKIEPMQSIEKKKRW